MTVKPTLYWNEKIVMSYLIQAASIHRRMPEVRVPGYHCLWPVTMQEDWDSLHDLLNGPTTLGSPMPSEVTFQEEVMSWLPILPREQQQMVWMRANRVPWKVLVEEFGRCKQTLFVRVSEGLQKLVVHLNRTDLRGDHFRQLRSRANSTFQDG
ncbi:MAG: hypothetical protein ACJAQT_000058 [Akkermansiaceae bacterium]|jgi:hypothetical protein